jgi:hypothetical protein
MQTFATRRGAKATPPQFPSSRSSSRSKFGSTFLLSRNPVGCLALMFAEGEIDGHRRIARDQSTFFDDPKRKFCRATADGPWGYDNGRMQSAECRMIARAPIDNEQICRYEFSEPAYHEHIADGTAAPRGLESHRSALSCDDKCRARLPRGGLARPEPARSIGLCAKVVEADAPFRRFGAAWKGSAERHRPELSKAEGKAFKCLTLCNKMCVYGLFIHCVSAHLDVSFLLQTERRLMLSRGRHPNAVTRAWVVRPWIVVDDL